MLTLFFLRQMRSQTLPSLSSSSSSSSARRGALRIQAASSSPRQQQQQQQQQRLPEEPLQGPDFSSLVRVSFFDADREELVFAFSGFLFSLLLSHLRLSAFHHFHHQPSPTTPSPSRASAPCSPSAPPPPPSRGSPTSASAPSGAGGGCLLTPPRSSTSAVSREGGRPRA